MKFKKLYQKDEFELVPYMKEYLKEHTDVDILIGCDSQNFTDRTIYAIVVAMHTPGKGAHVIFRRWKADKEPTRSIRLLNEVWYAIEAAEELKAAGLPKVKFIDIDINPDPKFKSNEVFRQAVGLVEGMGYSCRFKSLGPVATYAADHLVKV
jgi:predicted RNase H-related nuclease YkuK (DUF458 family)